MEVWFVRDSDDVTFQSSIKVMRRSVKPRVFVLYVGSNPTAGVCFMRNKRKEMGEEAWVEYQKQRKNDNTKAWKARNSQRVTDHRRNTKKKLIEYKGGKCEICGYNKDCPSVYHFHHRDPLEKEFGISGKGNTKKLESLKREADKCQLLCSNCHAEVHELLFKEQREATQKRHEEWLKSSRFKSRNSEKE